MKKLVVFILTVNIYVNSEFPYGINTKDEESLTFVISNSSGGSKSKYTSVKSKDSSVVKLESRTSRRVRRNSTIEYNYYKSESNKTNRFNITSETTIAKLNGTYDDDSFNITFEERKREDAFKRTKPKEHPYTVLLLMKSGKKTSDAYESVCSGTLLTNQWVLTAAHCVNVLGKKPVNKVIIYAGGNSMEEVKENNLASGSQILESTTFFKHPKYSSKSSGYDIAVIKTNGKFNLTDTVNTIELSTKPWKFYSYKTCVFTAFGVVQVNQKNVEDNTRKTHTLQVKSPCLCSFVMKALLGTESARGHLCTKPKEDYGVCPGDSGGGLICDGQIWGVAKLILALKNTDNCEISFFNSPLCGSRNTLSVFEKTCPFVRWVNSYVKLFDDSKISPDCQEPKGIGLKTTIPYPSLIFISVVIWAV